MSFLQPTKCSVQKFTVNGVDLVQHVNQLRIFETICKPYITGQAVVIDTNNILNNMGIVGGEPCSMTFFTGYQTKSYDLRILSVRGEQSSQSLRSMLYTIEMIGDEYFGDRKNLVQHSFKGTTGTDAIQTIHSQFIGGSLNIPVSSTGLIGKDNPYVVSSVKPFKAINDIRKLLSFGQYQTGSAMYFKNDDGGNLVPLEHLFATLSAMQNFEQRATWGANFSDIAAAENAIIAAAATINPSDKSGRVGVQDVSAAAVQERKVFDLLTNKLVYNVKAAQVLAGKVAGTPATAFLGSIASGMAGGHGGQQNYYAVDSSKIPVENTRQTEREKLYQALVKNGPQQTIKVPIQSGAKCTVGKGIYAKLIPPVGDLTGEQLGPQQAGGLMLVVDLMHELMLDDSQMSGTTTMRGVKGGFSP